MSIKRILALAIACAMLFAGMAVSAMAEAADGVYTGVGQGNHGDVVVETTIEGGVITAVNVTEQIENPDVAGKALVDIPAAIVANNAYNVDTVTGATVTSTAIETAVA